MRRWNGWGDDSIAYPVQPRALDTLRQQIGAGTAPRDVSLADVVAQVPDSRLAEHPLVVTDESERVTHSRGQSLPDLIALRSGSSLIFTDGVTYPTSREQVRSLIQYAEESSAQLIPYRGGTSVVGHVNVLPGSAPTLTVDLSRMSSLQNLDETSDLATFGAGVSGADLEASLRARGYTLGHFPQSFEYSTLGGWIATRSKGQQSLYYGGIERLFAGGALETPRGAVELAPVPGSAAGPDLRELILGSEGRIGVITEATMRVSRLPAAEEFRAVFFPTFEQGMAAVREIAQARLPFSMLRLLNEVETELTMSLGSHLRQRAMLEGLAYALREGKERCEQRGGIPVTELRVTGGGSQSDAALQLTADIFGLPASRVENFEASGLGAAIDAAVGLKLHPDFESAIGAMVRRTRTFEPNRSVQARYDELYHNVYQPMYGKLSPLYKAIQAALG